MALGSKGTRGAEFTGHPSKTQMTFTLPTAIHAIQAHTMVITGAAGATRTSWEAGQEKEVGKGSHQDTHACSSVLASAPQPVAASSGSTHPRCSHIAEDTSMPGGPGELLGAPAFPQPPHAHPPLSIPSSKSAHCPDLPHPGYPFLGTRTRALSLVNWGLEEWVGSLQPQDAHLGTHCHSGQDSR